MSGSINRTRPESRPLGDVLPLILFAILVGAAALKLPEGRRAAVIAGLELVTELMTGIVHFALRLAPYAVPAMIYSVIVKIGLGILATLGLFVAVCVAGMLLHLCGTLSLWLHFLAGRSPLAFFRDTRAVLVTAFSTRLKQCNPPDRAGLRQRQPPAEAQRIRIRVAAGRHDEHERNRLI